MPLSPHTGSQSLLEHEQPKLQSEYRDGSEYDKTSSLWGTTRLKIINNIITEKLIVKKKRHKSYYSEEHTGKLLGDFTYITVL